MADSTISSLNAILYSGVAAGDYMVIDDIDANITKKISAADVAKYVLGNRTIGGSSANDIVTINGTQTLTGKRLTSPKLNEDTAVTATATEVNVLDGIDATLTAADLSLLKGLAAAGVTNAEIGFLVGISGNIKTWQTSVDSNYNAMYLNKLWCYSVGFVASGTTKAITAATIKTALGISSSYIINPTSLNVQIHNVSGGTYSIFTGTQTTAWTTTTSLGQTYLDTITLGTLVNAQSYSVSIGFTLTEKVGI